MALYPLNPSGGIRSPRSGELAGDDWFASQGAPQMTAGPALRAQPPGSAFEASGAPQGWVTEEGLPARPPDLETAAQQANQIAYGGQGGGDVEYWRQMWNKDPGYAWKRMLGWQAGGKDVATSGPYAGGAGGVGGGGGAMPGGGVGGAFGTGVDYEGLRRLLGPGGEKELQQSPGYQFRLGEGLKALQKSAASRGTLLTGGTAKGLERYAQDFASNEYGNRIAQLTGLANLDLGAQQQRYGQLLGVSQLGLNAAGQQGVLGSQYAGLAGSLLGGQAANVSDLLTGRGNAQAAGTVGGANAWQQGLSGASNNALQTILLSQMMNRGIQTPGSPDYSWTANLAPGQYGPVRT